MTRLELPIVESAAQVIIEFGQLEHLSAAALTDSLIIRGDTALRGFGALARIGLNLEMLDTAVDTLSAPSARRLRSVEHSFSVHENANLEQCEFEALFDRQLANGYRGV